MTEDKKFREVVPCGMIYIRDREYFLLSLHPVQPDWETDEKRFAVVPVDDVGMDKDLNFLYSYARHIVIKGDYLIEYRSTIQAIKVWDLGVIDLSAIDLEPEDLEDEPDPVELADVVRSMEEGND